LATKRCRHGCAEEPGAAQGRYCFGGEARFAIDGIGVACGDLSGDPAGTRLQRRVWAQRGVGRQI